MQAISVQNLTVRYKDVTAVDGISFAVDRGEIFGIIGPNGAGKTSTLESIEGLRNYQKGEIRLFGAPMGNSKEIYKRIGIQLQETKLQDNLKVKELCTLYQSFYERPVDYHPLLAMFELSDLKNRLVKKLSGGQRQKLAIILALIGDPDILFLDEISTGLDPYARIQIWDTIKRFRDNGKTIIMTTHFMEEAELLCDRVCMVIDGKIKAIGTLYDLIHEANLPIHVRVKVSKGESVKLPEIMEGSMQGDSVHIQVRRPEQIGPAIQAVCEQTPVMDIDISKPSLEDVFFKLTGAKLEASK